MFCAHVPFACKLNPLSHCEHILVLRQFKQLATLQRVDSTIYGTQPACDVMVAIVGNAHCVQKELP